MSPFFSFMNKTKRNEKWSRAYTGGIKPKLQPISIAPLLTLRCKAIRGRILGVSAAWLGLGGVCFLGKPHPTQSKTYLRARISWDKTKGHATHGYSIVCQKSANIELEVLKSNPNFEGGPKISKYIKGICFGNGREQLCCRKSWCVVSVTPIFSVQSRII